MLIDDNGIADVCRQKAVPLTVSQVKAMDDIKLRLNGLIADLNNPEDGLGIYLMPGSERYIALAKTALEEACMWATKAICTPSITTTSGP